MNAARVGAVGYKTRLKTVPYSQQGAPFDYKPSRKLLNVHSTRWAFPNTETTTLNAPADTNNAVAPHLQTALPVLADSIVPKTMPKHPANSPNRAKTILLSD
jgi:hypothetical protein